MQLRYFPIPWPEDEKKLKKFTAVTHLWRDSFSVNICTIHLTILLFIDCIKLARVKQRMNKKKWAGNSIISDIEFEISYCWGFWAVCVWWQPHDGLREIFWLWSREREFGWQISSCMVSISSKQMWLILQFPLGLVPQKRLDGRQNVNYWAQLSPHDHFNCVRPFKEFSFR